MSITYGVTPTGFVRMPFAVIREQRNARHLALRGPSVDVSDGTLDGNWIAIDSEREDAIWQILQAIVTSQDPDAATDDAQDAIAAYSGTTRNQAASSSVTCVFGGVPTTVVPSGQIINTVSTKSGFRSVAGAVIGAALTAWIGSTVYAAGDRRTNAARCYQCLVGGTSAASGGPTTTAASIPDGAGTLVWTYIGEGTGVVDVLCASLVLDAVVAAARDLTDRQTFVGGWSSCINLTDATLGRPRQSNESLRITREAELADAGNGTPDAIRAAVLKVDGVTACTVFRNTTEVTDANGITPHATLVLVTGGLDAAIAKVLFDNVGSGMITVGTTLVNITDSQGTVQPYRFSRPSAQLMYAAVTLTFNPASASSGGYPLDGDTQVKNAIALFGQVNQTGGKDVINSSVRSSILPVFVNGVQVAGVQGVVDAVSLHVFTDVIGTPAAWIPSHAYVATPGARSVVTNDDGRTYICITSGTSAASGGPTTRGVDITDGTAHWYFLGNNITITDLQQAVFDTSRITVFSSAVGSL